MNMSLDRMIKVTLSVAVYNHYERINCQEELGVELQKSNVLLLGPTRVGENLSGADPCQHAGCSVCDCRCNDAY